MIESRSRCPPPISGTRLLASAARPGRLGLDCSVRLRTAFVFRRPRSTVVVFDAGEPLRRLPPLAFDRDRSSSSGLRRAGPASHGIALTSPSCGVPWCSLARPIPEIRRISSARPTAVDGDRPRRIGRADRRNEQRTETTNRIIDPDQQSKTTSQTAVLRTCEQACEACEPDREAGIRLAILLRRLGTRRGSPRSPCTRVKLPGSGRFPRATTRSNGSARRARLRSTRPRGCAIYRASSLPPTLMTVR